MDGNGGEECGVWEGGRGVVVVGVEFLMSPS